MLVLTNFLPLLFVLIFDESRDNGDIDPEGDRHRTDEEIEDGDAQQDCTDADRQAVEHWLHAASLTPQN